MSDFLHGLSMILLYFITAAGIALLCRVLIVLLCRGGLSTAGYIVIPLVTAFVSAVAELYSKDGYDTVICPLSAMVVLLPMIHLFGGLS